MLLILWFMLGPLSAFATVVAAGARRCPGPRERVHTDPKTGCATSLYSGRQSPSLGSWLPLQPDDAILRSEPMEWPLIMWLGTAHGDGVMQRLATREECEAVAGVMRKVSGITSAQRCVEVRALQPETEQNLR